MVKIKRVPYGLASFSAFSRSNSYYVDKTMYIPEIEKSRYVFLNRPRRFGKSLFLTTLASYYNINSVHKYDVSFKDTWIHENPTEEKGSYLILHFNFSAILKDLDKMQDDFNNYCGIVISNFLFTYKDLLSERIIDLVENEPFAHVKLHKLAVEIHNTGQKLYILIDEYDHFTNVLLSEQGQEAYEKITKKEGFFRQFFTNLKLMTSGEELVLDRLFITGVSPVTMDDVSSGFNIGDNISMLRKYNGIVGFTEKDVSEILDYYISTGELKIDKEAALPVLKKWYDNYIFASDSTESVFNTDGIWYFVKESIGSYKIANDLIDDNLRMDFSKLRNLVVLNKKLNGNLNLLANIISEGGISSNINKSFPYERIIEPINFISMLYYLGLLSFSGKLKDSKPYLRIPNETIKSLMYDYIEICLEDTFDFYHKLEREEFYKLIYYMGINGVYKPAFEYIASEMNKMTSIRDFIEGEKVVKLFYMIYLSHHDLFLVSTEREMNKGFADIVMIPFIHRYNQLNFTFLIEFKYINRSVQAEKLQKTIDEKVSEAKTQLEKYSPLNNTTEKKLIVVFHGWEMVYLEEV